MAISPQTNIRLIKTPFEIDNKNQLTFTSENAQKTYFLSLPYIEEENCTYQRKDNVIRFPALVDDILEYNYVMYQNEAYSNKWFYAFITKMTYLNNNCTEIAIETDVFQTWQFDIIYKQSFVEREHVNDDTIGLHTVPENLELGEYINQKLSGTEDVDLNFLLTSENHKNYVVLGVTETGLNVSQPAPDYNGVFGGLIYLVFPTFADCRSYILFSQTQFSSDNIICAFMVPYEIGIQGENFSWYTHSSGFQYGFIMPTSTPTQLRNINISKPSFLDENYIPRNNKLLTFPYVFFSVTNNSGSYSNYMYEYFKNIDGSETSNCKFVIEGSIGVGCSIKLIPFNYKNGNSILNSNEPNYAESLDAGKLPTCSWTNDAYTNWLTQNAVNIPLQIIGGVGKIAGGAFVGNGSVALGGISDIGNTLIQMYEHSLMPETAKGGVNQGDLTFAQKISFSLYKRSIKREYAEIIDKYFDLAGYKVNKVKIPNVTGRTNWNYVKTLNCNLLR